MGKVLQKTLADWLSSWMSSIIDAVAQPEAYELDAGITGLDSMACVMQVFRTDESGPFWFKHL